MVSTPWDPRFVPGDPLISPDFGGWWQRGFAIVRRGWRPMAVVQALMAVPALALLVPTQASADLAQQRMLDNATAGQFAGFDAFFGPC